MLTTTAVCIGVLNSKASAEAFDWSASLGLSTASFSEKFSSIGKCQLLRYSVNTETINLTSITQERLKDPLSNEKPYSAIINLAAEVPSDISYEKNRYYRVPEINRVYCTIGAEAEVYAYAHNDKVFHIELTYTRCSRYVTNSPTCAEYVNDSQPYDKELFEKISKRNSYKYTFQGTPPKLGLPRTDTVSGYEDLDSDLEHDLLCGSLDRIQGRHDTSSWRCIRDIDSSDPKKWTGIAMWEQYESGVIWDSNLKHYASKRYFVDLITERQAIKAMNVGLQNYISQIQSEIRTKIEAVEDKTQKLNSVLGGD